MQKVSSFGSDSEPGIISGKKEKKRAAVRVRPPKKVFAFGFSMGEPHRGRGFSFGAGKMSRWGFSSESDLVLATKRF